MKNTIQENYEIELIRKQTDLQKRSGHLRLFYIVDGSAVFSVNGVPCSVRHGDILQASQGDICELVIYNEAKDFDFVAQDHENYLQTPGFIGN